jgi:hypothetical protein
MIKRMTYVEKEHPMQLSYIAMQNIKTPVEKIDWDEIAINVLNIGVGVCVGIFFTAAILL